MDRQTDWDILCSRFFLYLMSWRIRESAGVWKVFHKWGSLGHKTETWLTKNLQDREPDLLNMSHSLTQHWLMTQWQLMVIFTCQLPYLQGRRPQTMWHHIPAGSNCQLTTVRTSLSLCQVYTIRHSEKCIVKYSYNKSQRDAQFLKLIFDKELYMFRRVLLSIIRSRNTVYAAIGICHASYVDSLLARSGWNCSLSKINLRNSASRSLALIIRTYTMLPSTASKQSYKNMGFVSSANPPLLLVYKCLTRSSALENLTDQTQFFQSESISLVSVHSSTFWEQFVSLWSSV